MATFAYDSSAFARFYDRFVSNLPPEFEVGLRAGYYVQLFGKLASSCADMHAFRLLDLCTGTGSVVKSILTSLNTSTGPVAVDLVGVDISQAMLDLAAESLQPIVPLRRRSGQVASRGGAGSVTLDLVRADIGNGLQGVLQGPFELVILSAGSFHHLSMRAEQRRLLEDVAALLDAHGIFVMDLFDNAEVTAQPSEEDVQPLTIDGQRWVRTARQHQHMDDGGTICIDTFSIGLAAAPTSTNDQPAAGTEGGQGTAAGPTSGPAAASTEQLTWSLRAVEHQELRDLATQAGLSVAAEYGSFADAVASKPASRVATSGARVFCFQKSPEANLGQTGEPAAGLA